MFVRVIHDRVTGVSTVRANDLEVHREFDHDAAVGFARGYLAYRGGGLLEYHDGLRWVEEHVKAIKYESSPDDGVARQRPVAASW